MTVNRKMLLQEIGKRLKKVRENLNYSLEEMARELGVSQSGYYKNEGGISFPQLHTLFLLLHDFNISLDWLISDQGPMFYEEKQREIELTAGKELGLEDKSPEVRELLDLMEHDPLLRHELLVYFYKYKNRQKSHEVENIKD